MFSLLLQSHGYQAPRNSVEQTFHRQSFPSARLPDELRLAVRGRRVRLRVCVICWRGIVNQRLLDSPISHGCGCVTDQVKHLSQLAKDKLPGFAKDRTIPALLPGAEKLSATHLR